MGSTAELRSATDVLEIVTIGTAETDGIATNNTTRTRVIGERGEIVISKTRN